MGRVKVRAYVRAGRPVQAHERSAPEPSDRTGSDEPPSTPGGESPPDSAVGAAGRMDDGWDDPWHTREEADTLDHLWKRFAGRVRHYAKEEDYDPDDLSEVWNRRDVVAEWLDDTYAATVDERGRLDPSFLWLDDFLDVAGDLPIVLMHHTSSALLPQIAREGLTAASKGAGNRDSTSTHHGVYLTTEVSGPTPAGYQLSAVQRFGGEPVSLAVTVQASDLRPDPDDSDLYSVRNLQAVVDYVPPDQIDGLDELTKAITPDRVAARGRVAGVGVGLATATHDDLDLLLPLPSLWLDRRARYLVAEAAGLGPELTAAFVADPEGFCDDPAQAALVEYELDGAWASMVEQWT